MAKRCDNCKHWVETVFLGESASGYGCWEGICQNPEVPRPGVGQRDRHNLMLACPKFEEGAHPKSLSGLTETRTTRAASMADGGFPHTTLDRK